MKADLSRSTFSPAKHYRDVRWQMGRVPMDADLNEYVDIAAHRVETGMIDVVGRCGGPLHDAAFQLAATVAELPADQQAAALALGPLVPGDFLLSAGRYYVHGVLVENPAPLRFTGQETGDLPGTGPIQASGLYLAYLDVWARHLTHLDDPAIREVALGGPDTTTRNKNVWQLKLVRVGDSGTAPDCDGEFPAYAAATAAGTGTLAAEVDPDITSKKPCVLPPGGGYRRLENQLYRVEVHAAGAAGGTATFKWSRDNGSIVSGWEPTNSADTLRLLHPPRDEVLGFAVGHWVELTDDRNELLGLPGQLCEITQVDGELLKLKTPIPAGIFTRNPKVRRWDGVDATPITTGAWIPLEDGVRVRFSAGTFKTGDYWMIPARTATADVEWPRPGGVAAFLPPQGILHWYCRVGFVDFDGTRVATHDCRPLFPPLTELEGGCDLKLHNRHLHGKGVVCGLQVQCGGDDGRQAVTVRPGHAIDCAGTDLLLKAPVSFPVVERAKAAELLDAAGNGEVLVTLAGDAQDQPVLGVAVALPEPKGPMGILRQILEGTLWMDFYQDCLKPLVDFLREQLLERDPDDPSLVPKSRRRLLAVANLLAHRSENPASHRLWLSATEHELLQELYDGLVGLAKGSKVHCGLATSFPAFPAYPFGEADIRTGFAARRLAGVRPGPGGRLAVTWSAGEAGKIQIFDLESGEMTLEPSVEGADGLAVQDVVFTTFRGIPVMVVAAAGNGRTVLSVLETKTFSAVVPPFVLTGAVLSRMEVNPRFPEMVLAVERGAGLHVLDLARLVSGPVRPTHPFNATGHLAVSFDRACLPAAPAGTGATSTYTILRFGGWDGAQFFLSEREVLLARIDTRVASGEDGVAWAMGPRGPVVHVVVNPAAGQAVKRVLVVGGEGKEALSLADLPPADDGGDPGTGPVSLADAGGDTVVYAVARRNHLLGLPGAGGAFLKPGFLPAQSHPLAVSIAGLPGNEPRVISANRDGQTLTLIPARHLTDPTVGEGRVKEYRDGLLQAFQGLLVPLLQQLKDCLCQHLLVDCAACADDEPALTLAKVRIVEGRVEKICGFERTDVLTFPKVQYWLSAVPIIPLVGYLVEKFCCWTLREPRGPATAANAGNTGLTHARPGLTKAGAASALSLTQAGVLDVLEAVRSGTLGETLGGQAARLQAVAAHFLQQSGRELVRPPSDAAAARDILGQTRESAAARLDQAGVVVEAVESYDAAMDTSGAKLSADQVPAFLKAGERVRLYTRGDQVVLYQRVTPAAAGDSVAGALAEEMDRVRGRLAALQDLQAADRAAREAQAAAVLEAAVRRTGEELAARDRRIEELRAANEKLQAEVVRVTAATARPGVSPAELEARDRQIAELRAANEQLGVTVRELAARPAPAGVSATDLQAGLEALRGELAARNQAHAAELAARDRQIVELRTATEKLSTDLQTSNEKLRAEIARVRVNRPPNP